MCRMFYYDLIVFEQCFVLSNISSHISGDMQISSMRNVTLSDEMKLQTGVIDRQERMSQCFLYLSSICCELFIKLSYCQDSLKQVQYAYILEGQYLIICLEGRRCPVGVRSLDLSDSYCYRRTSSCLALFRKACYFIWTVFQPPLLAKVRINFGGIPVGDKRATGVMFSAR